MDLLANNNYRNRSFLIVDHVKQSRDTLKTFAVNQGCSRVDLCFRLSEVIFQCENFDYDVILLGYDLGEDRENGQQVLEEIRQRSLISRHCIVIMITGEVTQAMVLAALEHKPNEYLAKPYTLQDLHVRITRSFKKIAVMKDIYKALDESSPNAVIELCDIQIALDNAYKTECLGIKSRQLLALGREEEARDIYKQSLNLPNCQWAHIGLGKIALNKNDLYKASDIFESVIETYPKYMSAYEHLVDVYQKQNNGFKLEAILEKAVALSPRSFTFVKQYAQACFDNQHFESATQAFFKVNSLGKNSIHHSPDNAFGLTKSFLELANELPEYKVRRLKPEVFKVLLSSGKEFGSFEIKIQTGLLAAQLHFVVKEVMEGVKTLTRAENLLDKKVNDLSDKGMEEIAHALNRLNRQDKAKELFYLLEQSKFENKSARDAIDVDAETYTPTELKKAQLAIASSITHYRHAHYSEAIKELQKALNLYPKHVGIKLNLLQVLLVAFETDKRKEDEFTQAADIILSLSFLTRSSKSFERYNRLKRRYDSMNN